MCMATTCNVCKKATWNGCGKHIPSAMSQTPKNEWCTCLEADGSRGEYPPKVGTGIAK